MKKQEVLLVFTFGAKHCSGICKKQKAEELVVKKLLFKLPEEQSSPLQHGDKAATFKKSLLCC